MTSHPPRDLTSLLVEVRVPDDVEKCFWAKKFREHLGTIGRSDLEAMLDFVIVCNVLRNKESEVKNCRNMKWRIVELNKERRGVHFTNMFTANFCASFCAQVFYSEYHEFGQA